MFSKMKWHQLQVFFSSRDDTVMNLPVQEGDKAEMAGRYCVDSKALALLERALGAHGVSEVEKAMSGKQCSGIDCLVWKKGGQRAKVECESCQSLPVCETVKEAKEVVCGGLPNYYECTEASINKVCGSLANACCSDADGSCSDGDDSIACVATLGINGNDYGTLEPCNTTQKYGIGPNGGFCYSMNKDTYPGCTLDTMIKWCKSTDKACCADKDGSCTDFSDEVGCFD